MSLFGYYKVTLRSNVKVPVSSEEEAASLVADITAYVLAEVDRTDMAGKMKVEVVLEKTSPEDCHPNGTPWTRTQICRKCLRQTDAQNHVLVDYSDTEPGPLKAWEPTCGDCL